MRPGEPHLLAARVERDRQAGEHAVARAERRVLQEQPGLGVDERGGGPVRDGHALGRARRAAGEDDPGVVVEARARAGRRPASVSQVALGEHPRDAGLAEHGPRALVGVVHVHRHVRGAGRQHGEDRGVELGRARRDAHADPVARPDAGRRQPRRARRRPPPPAPGRSGPCCRRRSRGRPGAPRRVASSTSSSVRGGRGEVRPEEALGGHRRASPSLRVPCVHPIMRSRPAKGDPRTRRGGRPTLFTECSPDGRPGSPAPPIWEDVCP